MKSEYYAQWLAKNIRFLCMLEGTISAAATNIGINRQQLNKYLNGTSVPSVRTLAKICNYFSIDETEIFLPTEELRGIVGIRSQKHNRPERFESILNRVTEEATGIGAELKEYVGNYFGYSISRSPARINRYFIKIYQVNGLTFTANFEAYCDLDSCEREPVFFHRFDGVIVPAGDRMSIIYAENVGTPRMTLSTAIFYPSTFHKLEFIKGKVITVSNFGMRPIFYSPLAMEPLGRGRPKPSWFKELGFAGENSDKIRPDIRGFLNENYFDQWS